MPVCTCNVCMCKINFEVWMPTYLPINSYLGCRGWKLYLLFTQFLII